MPLYFAYGSNMETAQMRVRLGDARPTGVARLLDHRFVCNKIGRDGSAKANVEASRGDEVWGVLYEITEDALAQLDRFEGGYWRERHHVIRSDGSFFACVLYVSDKTDAELVPSRAYRDRMVRGAREHRLPDPYAQAIEDLPVGD